MNTEVKEKWLNALRSGEYRQGTAFLKRGEALCCLGVLCDLFIKDGGKAHWEVIDGKYFSNIVVDDNNVREYKVLPSIIQNWAGLKEANPATSTYSLALLNDKGDTFEQIADVIETQL